MPNAVWTGSLSFGLVSVPVRLFPATEPKDVRFHLYDASGRRVRYQRVVADEPPMRAEPPGPSDAHEEPSDADVEPSDAGAEPARERGAAEPSTAIPAPGVGERALVEREVGWDELLRGRETESGDVVLLTRDEIERVRPQRSRAIDVEDFVDLGDVDPVYFDKTYYAVPRDGDAAKPYALLHRAMQRAGRAGIGRFVLRTKPHLVAVRPMQQILAIQTLFFGDEVRDPAAMVPDLAGVEVREREVELAEQLIEMLRTEWNPGAYADEYRQELLRLLAEKETVRPPEAATTTERAGAPIEELMTALRESVEAAKRGRGGKKTRKRAG